MNQKIYLHIGYPKTGTTFLQFQYFPFIEEVYFINQEKLFKSGFLNLIYDDITITDVEKYNIILNQWKEEAGGKSLFISYEGFMGNIYAGLKNLPTVIERLKAISFEFKLLVTIRRQQDIINSSYVQYVHQGGALKFKKFIQLKGSSPLYLSLTIFDYYKVYQLLIKAFGKDNVTIIPFESIRNMEEFNQHLSDYFSKAITITNKNFKRLNEGVSGFNFHLLRASNRLFSSWVSPNGVVPSKFLNTIKLRFFLQRINFSKKKNKFYEGSTYCLSHNEFYAKSNQLLQEEIGIDLKSKYNYL